ncbi:MAG TPA: hypothetical protein VEF33_00635 [Syntrophales bacterium]|nr:hypothetical protein [Syntrophales bacterium]
MTYLPVILFAIAALGGLTLVYLKFSGQTIPMSLAIIHGLFAAAGLVALIVNVASGIANTLMNISLVLFVIVAIGGFILFSFYVRKKELPNALIAIHGIGAVISFVLLLIAVFA